jgi:hypothetical protein
MATAFWVFAMIGAEAGEVMAMAVSRPAAGNSSNEA